MRIKVVGTGPAPLIHSPEPGTVQRQSSSAGHSRGHRGDPRWVVGVVLGSLGRGVRADGVWACLPAATGPVAAVPCPRPHRPGSHRDPTPTRRAGAIGSCGCRQADSGAALFVSVPQGPPGRWPPRGPALARPTWRLATARLAGSASPGGAPGAAGPARPSPGTRMAGAAMPIDPPSWPTASPPWAAWTHDGAWPHPAAGDRRRQAAVPGRPGPG
jgi:hypothetical protein